MMEIYVEDQQHEEETEEQENSKRRISRPKLKYSPVPEINKKRVLKKHLNRPKLNVQRINSGSAQTIFSDSSTSALSTRENSSDEEDFAGRDVMSQTELHQQLKKIKPEEFSLPYYDIKKILENGTSLPQTIKTYIPLLPLLADDRRNEVDEVLTQNQEIDMIEPVKEPIPIEKPRLKLKIKLPFKKHTVQSTLKRMRKPPRRSDEFIFTPLKKQQPFYKKDPLKLRQALINRQKRHLQEQEMATYSQSIQMAPPKRIKQRRGLMKIMKQPAIGSTQQSDGPSPKKLLQQVSSAGKIERPPQPKIPPAIESTQQSDEPSTKELLQQVPSAKKIERPPQPKIPEVPSVQMEFFDRLNHRKQLNPFSIGIKRCENFRDDYFYREILISDTPSNLEHENEEEIEIDCTGISASELECKDDEKMLHNPAAEFAKAIQKEMENSEEYSPIDLEQPESDFESIIKERMNDMDSNIRSFLDVLYKFIIEQRYVDTVTQGLIGGASMFHSLTMKNANRLRESLKLYNKVNQKLIVAAHCWLLKNLPIEFIASYLNILRFVKAAGSNLSDHIVSHSNGKCIARANHLIKDYIRQKIYEPPMNANFKPIEYGPIPNASLVLVYPQITAKTTKHIIRAHETLFRQLLPLVVCCVEKVELNFDVDKQITVEECAWMCIHLIRQKVNEIVKRRPTDHIFLAGWGTTCCINHKVVTRVPGVSGILNFAFPTETACGSRGSIDDEICLTYPSTLFVVGEDAFNVNMNALMRMRRNMISDTGLIVIGDANHNLLVSQTRLSIERITQFVIQRTIVEYTVQFIKQVIADLGHRKDCRELLKPVILPNMYEVDINLLKQPTTTKPKKPPGQKKAEEAERQSQIGSMQQPSTSTSAFGYSKISGHSRPTQIASHLPSGLQPVIPASSSRVGTYHAARSTFGGLLKAAKASSIDMAGGIKIPSPETLNSQVFKAATTRMTPSTSTALQDTLREEEEAAAALKF